MPTLILGMVGSGQAPLETSEMGISNSAGIDVELKLNGKHFKEVPTGASGTITLSVTKGVTSKLEAVAVHNGAQLLLNGDKTLVITGGKHPERIIITSQNSKYFYAINILIDIDVYIIRLYVMCYMKIV